MAARGRLLGAVVFLFGGRVGLAAVGMVGMVSALGSSSGLSALVVEPVADLGKQLLAVILLVVVLRGGGGGVVRLSVGLVRRAEATMSRATGVQQMCSPPRPDWPPALPAMPSPPASLFIPRCQKFQGEQVRVTACVMTQRAHDDEKPLSGVLSRPWPTSSS